jgi:hypothetical protein
MINANNSQYVNSPTPDDYIAQEDKSIKFAAEQSKDSRRLLGAMGRNINSIDKGLNSFKYAEALLFSTADASFSNTDNAITDENYFTSVKDNPGVVYNVIKFNKRYNIRTFDFILTYRQFNSWGADIYKPVSITKQFRGNLIFTGCSNIKDLKSYELLPLKLHTRYELIGDSLGSGDSVTKYGSTKGGPTIYFTYECDEEYVYLYISNLFPYEYVPVAPGILQGISNADNSSYFTHESHAKKIIEKDHISGVLGEAPADYNPITYCEVYLSLRDTTINNFDSGITVASHNSLNDSSVFNSQTIRITPTRYNAVGTSGFSIHSDTNTEAAVDIHPLGFGHRALASDKDAINDIADKIDCLIKNASLSTVKVPFIIEESIRFSGAYNIINDVFIDAASDSFGKLLIKEAGYYDALLDTYNITSYQFDFSNAMDKNTVTALKDILANVYPELALNSNNSIIPATLKTTKPLAVIGGLEFVTMVDFEKYKKVVFIDSTISNKVKQVFIEFKKENNVNDYNKIIYFTNDNEILICDFTDYAMKYCIKETLFKSHVKYRTIASITSIDRYTRSEYPYSYFYLIGTNIGVYYELYLNDSYYPVINPVPVNPFLASAGNQTTDILSNDSIEKITVEDSFVYFIGSKSQFALYDINKDEFITIIPNDFNKALCGKPIKIIKKLNDTQIMFITTDAIKVYDIQNRVWTSKDNNFAYAVDFKDPYGSSMPVHSFNFGVDDYSEASVIQTGYFLYCLGARNGINKPEFKRFDIFTGIITGISEQGEYSDTNILETLYQHAFFVAPFVCTNEKYIYCLGGKTVSEIENGNFQASHTILKRYNILLNVWENETMLLFPVINPINQIETTGRLQYGNPIIAPDDEYIYLFSPELKTGIGNIYQEAVGFKISVLTGIIDAISLTGIEVTNDILNKKSSWLPLKWNTDGAEFGMMFRVTDMQNTYYKFCRFSILYETGEAAVLDERLITDPAFLNYTTDNLPFDAFRDAKVFNDKNRIFIYFRDKFILLLDGNDFTLYPLWAQEASEYPSLIDKETYDAVWAAGGAGNKTHKNTYFVHKENYLIFSGGGGCRHSDYFDLNTLNFIHTPRYYAVENMGEGLISAAQELKAVPDSFNAFSTLSFCMIDKIQYIVCSITADTLALDKYNNETANTNRASLLLFKLDTGKDEKVIEFVSDITPRVEINNSFCTIYRFISMYAIGDMLFIHPARNLSAASDGESKIFEHSINTTGVIFDTKNNIKIECTADDIPVMLYPLIFQVKNGVFICSDEANAVHYPALIHNTSGYKVTYVTYENNQPVFTPRVNSIKLSSHTDGSSKAYAAGAVYSKYGFIATESALEIIDIEDLANGNNIQGKVIYRFDAKDKALLKDIIIEDDYLYITGGIYTQSLQGDAPYTLNNRMLRMYIPDIIAIYENTVMEELNCSEIVYTMQLSSPAVKYFSGYSISKRSELLTIGELFFIYEQSQYAAERDSLDALIAPKIFTYPAIQQAFIQGNDVSFTGTIEPFQHTDMVPVKSLPVQALDTTEDYSNLIAMCLYKEEEGIREIYISLYDIVLNTHYPALKLIERTGSPFIKSLTHSSIDIIPLTRYIHNPLFGGAPEAVFLLITSEKRKNAEGDTVLLAGRIVLLTEDNITGENTNVIVRGLFKIKIPQEGFGSFVHTVYYDETADEFTIFQLAAKHNDKSILYKGTFDFNSLYNA